MMIKSQFSQKSPNIEKKNPLNFNLLNFQKLHFDEQEVLGNVILFVRRQK